MIHVVVYLTQQLYHRHSRHITGIAADGGVGRDCGHCLATFAISLVVVVVVVVVCDVVDVVVMQENEN